MTTNESFTATPDGGRVLVCADAAEFGELASTLQRWGFDAAAADSPEQAFEELCREQFDICLVNDPHSHSVAQGLAARLQEARLATQLICLVPDNGTVDGAALESAGCDVVSSTMPTPVLQSTMRAAAERARLLLENQRLKRQLSNRTLREMVGNTPAVHQLRSQVQQAADDSRTALITGEPGTGTNLVAHGIHDASRRAFRPFVRFDCRLLSADCLERELFGSDEETASTQFNMPEASGGTVFLDNVDALALPSQKRITMALSALGFKAASAQDGATLDFRVIAATHANLEEKIEAKLFRRDLYEQLTAIHITTPTLRERKPDICLLAEHFLNRRVVLEGKPVRKVTLDALQLLEDYDWPGNVRELGNVIERACSLDHGTRLTAEMLRPWLAGEADNSAATCGITLKEMERKLIEATFARCEGNRELTAQTLQIGLRTLSGKLREYGYPPRGGPGSNLKIADRKAA